MRYVIAIAVAVLTFSLVPIAEVQSTGSGVRTAMGKQIKNRKLPRLEGGEQEVFKKADANVVLFFRPGHEHSLHALAAAGEAAGELKGKSVSWVALVSDRHDLKQAKAEVKEAGLAMPVLIDKGDVLYSEMMVKVRPTFAVLDRDQKVVAWQAFHKLNLEQMVVARVRHVLKELTDEELDKILNPAPQRLGKDDDKAHRFIAMGHKLLAQGKADMAEKMARKGIEMSPALADAHALLGSSLAALKNCKAALPAFAEALKLDPKHAEALAGKEKCAQ